MKPWQLLDRAAVPASANELRLYQRDAEFSIRIGDIELMNSRASHSEAVLSQLGCARIANRRAPRVLIGGLGMGFSLRAALAVLPPDAVVEVAELVPEVVRWNETHLAALAEHPLRDPRVIVLQEDVVKPIRAAHSSYDAVLLDIDNGPATPIRPANTAVYSASGLGEIRRALRPSGVVGIWSCGEEPRFVARLKRAGFEVEQVAVRGRKGKGARYVVWLGTLLG